VIISMHLVIRAGRARAGAGLRVAELSASIVAWGHPADDGAPTGHLYGRLIPTGCAWHLRPPARNRAPTHTHTHIRTRPASATASKEVRGADESDTRSVVDHGAPLPGGAL
jgi:hypothetical protein